jgi:hypothetical protein
MSEASANKVSTNTSIIAMIDSAWIGIDRLSMLLLAQLDYFGRNAFRRCPGLRSVSIYVVTSAEEGAKFYTYNSVRDFQKNYPRQFGVARSFALRKSIRTVSGDDTKIIKALTDLDVEVMRISSSSAGDIKCVLLIEPTLTTKQHDQYASAVSRLRTGLSGSESNANLFIYSTLNCLIDNEGKKDMYIDSKQTLDDIHLLEMKLLDLVCFSSIKEREENEKAEMNTLIKQMKSLASARGQVLPQ